MQNCILSYSDNGRFRFPLLRLAFQRKTSQVLFTKMFCRKDSSQVFPSLYSPKFATFLVIGLLRFFIIVIIIMFFQKVNYIYNFKSFHLDSTMIVTGPSFTNDTFISAPKIPVSTVNPYCLNSSLKDSHNGFATSGLAASIKLGRLPFFVSA